MFIQSCYINKNTEKLRTKLINLGYKKHPDYIETENDSSIYLNRGFYSNRPIGYIEEIKGSINCKCNERMFLAIASLRDDTNLNQWFTDDDKDIWKIYDDEAFSYDREKDCYMFEGYEEIAHKATVEELVKYFEENSMEEIMDISELEKGDKIFSITSNGNIQILEFFCIHPYDPSYSLFFSHSRNEISIISNRFITDIETYYRYEYDMFDEEIPKMMKKLKEKEINKIDSDYCKRRII